MIVGGGPAGLTTALYLQRVAPRLAERTVVLERARYPREKICAGAIGGRGLAVLDAIGALPEVPRVEVKGIAVTTREGRLVERSSECVGWVVRRREFDAALASVASSRGIQVREGITVDSVERCSNGSFSLGVIDGEPIGAEVVVAADGVRSVVRRALGWRRGEVFAQAAEVDTARVIGDLPEDVLHFDLRAGDLHGYAWDFPTMLEGRLGMCRGFYDVGGYADGRSSTDLGTRLDAHVPEAERLGTRKRFAERCISVGEPLSKPGVLLTGEAAGIDPVLGEGIAQAIQYGRATALYLAAKLDRGDGARHFSDYAPLARRSRLAIDLRARAWSLPWVYGSRSRSVLERLVRTSPALARAGLAYFGGLKVQRGDLLRASWDLLRAAL